MRAPLLMPKNGVLTITPADINRGEHFWNAFDHNETEISANYVVGLCQEKGGWLSFSEAEIESFYQKSGHHGYSFNRLVEPGAAYHRGERTMEGGDWIVRSEDGLFHVTVDFALRCYRASPKKS